MHKYPSCNSALLLAKFHWHLLKADHLLFSACFPRKHQPQSGIFEFAEIEVSDFGRLVKGEPIHWWIFWQCSDVAQLKEKTEKALCAAEVLRTDILNLPFATNDYNEFIESISQFTESRSQQVSDLVNYVEYLDSCHPMAASIVYSHKVWGTTERHWRNVPCEAVSFSEEASSIKQDLIEAVYGLKFQSIHIVDEKMSGLCAEVAEEVYSNPEKYFDRVHSKPNEKTAIALAIIVIRERMITYFKEIRNSLRTILHEIATYYDTSRLAVSERFWHDLICKCSSTPLSENELWDLKQTLTMFHAVDKKDKRAATIDFVERVAAFANCDGGVLIIGVTDGNRDIIGIPRNELEDRIKHIADVIEKRLDPEFTAYHVIQVPVIRGGTAKVCVNVVIAQSKAAIGVKQDDGSITYPSRKMSGIERVVPYAKIVERKRNIILDNYIYINRLREFITGP